MKKSEILRLNENGETKLYVPYKDYKELKKKYVELSSAENEYKKEIKLHDLVNYNGFKWYVIGIQKDVVTLMAKETIEDMTYSDNNSNDWIESNVREYLKTDFLSKFNNKGDLINMMINYDENKFSYEDIRIPTLREIESLPMEIRKCAKTYWTMTSSYGISDDRSNAYVFFVSSGGSLGSDIVDYTYVVRPVIQILKERCEINE